MGAWGQHTPASREAEPASAFATKKRMSLFASAENPIRTPLVPFKNALIRECNNRHVYNTRTHTHTVPADGPGID